MRRRRVVSCRADLIADLIDGQNSQRRLFAKSSTPLRSAPPQQRSLSTCSSLEHSITSATSAPCFTTPIRSHEATPTSCIAPPGARRTHPRSTQHHETHGRKRSPGRESRHRIHQTASSSSRAHRKPPWHSILLHHRTSSKAGVKPCAREVRAPRRKIALSQSI